LGLPSRNNRTAGHVESAMAIDSITPSQRTAARVAGLAWPIAFFFVVAVSFTIFFPLAEVDSAAELARRVLADERLFRIGIAGYMVNAVAIVVQAAAFYMILEPVDRMIALLGAFARLAWAFTWMIVTLNLLMVLHLLKDGPLDLARLYLGRAGGSDTYYVGLLFWTLAAAVGGWLFFKSRYVPRALAAYGVIASAWCAACTFVYYIFPGFADVVNLWWFDSPMVIFELALSGWLLFIGLKPSRTAAAARPSTGG
jgi:uncharacterized protein DUF4386